MRIYAFGPRPRPRIPNNSAKSVNNREGGTIDGLSGEGQVPRGWCLLATQGLGAHFQVGLAGAA